MQFGDPLVRQPIAGPRRLLCTHMPNKIAQRADATSELPERMPYAYAAEN